MKKLVTFLFTALLCAISLSVLTACGKYSVSIKKNTPAHDHEWGEPNWYWNDYDSAVVTFTCKTDDSHINTVNATVSSNTIAATCESDGKTVYTATATFEDKTYTDEKTVILPALGHKYHDPVWVWGDNHSATALFVCENDVSHTITESAVVTIKTDAATCTEEGAATYIATADFNGNVYTDGKTEILPILGHDYVSVITSPTCTEQGYTTYTCSRCNDSYVSDNVAALGHDYESVVTSAKCTEQGYTTYTCSRCNDSYVSDNVAALGHDYAGVATLPTCTEQGYTTYTCSRCNDSYVSDNVAALGHIDENDDYICDRCGYIIKTEGLEYTINSDGKGYSAMGIGTATDTNIIIPATYNDKPVTSIGNYAFSGCTSLTNVTIPDSVTKVGELAFNNCGAQSEIDGFYVVDDWVFDARSFPSTVIIPEGIVGIADYTFSESGIESAFFPSTLKYIGYASFWDSCLRYISFENPDVIINSRAFSQTFLNKIDYNGTTKQWLALNYIENSCESYKVYCTDGILNRDGTEYLEVTPNEYFTFTYIQATNSYSVKKATTSMPEIVVIPSEYNDKPVTQIASSAFSYSYNKIKRIVIPDSITIIGDWAFCDCVELENINIPDGVTIIGRSVFEHCYKLANVQIPFGVESIGLNAFRYCYLSSIEIPDSVTDIGEDAFYNCSNLTSVTMGNGVTSIGRGAFDDCSSLTSVTIGDGVTSIGDSAFNNCNSLTSVTIPDSVMSIGRYAFSGCSSLTNVTIGNGVTSIGEGVFRDCSSLTSVTIGNSVESIGNYAFSGCTSLTSITIPDSVTSIDFLYAFSNCSGLMSLNIGNGVTSIDYGAFSNCSSLTNVTIGNGVTSIGERAFSNCSNLSSVTIGRSVNSIGNYAFDNCKKLLKVYYNGTAQDWYDISIIEPYNSNCYLSYTTRYYYSETQPTDSGNYWHYVDGEPTVWEVYTQGLEYSLNEDGESYSVTGIGTATDTDIIIPSAYNGKPVTKIANSAFKNCNVLTNVTIGNNVTIIGSLAFYNCTGLTSIEIPDSVTSIGYNAFFYCTDLTNINVDNNNEIYKSIDGNLYNKAGTELIQYAIGKETTSFTTPDSVTSINKEAFEYCKNLTSVTFGGSVTSIGESAFLACSNLSSITFKGTKAQWQAITKGNNWNFSISSDCKVYCSDETFDVR